MTLLISSMATVMKMILWQSIKSLSWPEHHKANILLFLSIGPKCVAIKGEDGSWRALQRQAGVGKGSSEPIGTGSCGQLLLGLGASHWARFATGLGKAGVIRAFSLQEWQPWGGDEGVRAEDVYSLTWHLLRENILSQFFFFFKPKLKWIRHS